jgi:hypothetical protein
MVEIIITVKSDTIVQSNQIEKSSKRSLSSTIQFRVQR